MPEHLMSAEEISDFLTGLGSNQQKSRGERALASSLIRRNRPAIDEFIKDKIKSDRHGLADHYQRLVGEYEDSPPGAFYNLTTGSLMQHWRSFQHWNPHNFTIQTDNEYLRWGIRALLVTGIAVILFGGCRYCAYLNETAYNFMAKPIYDQMDNNGRHQP